MQLSPHFTLEEATFSATAERLGIDNFCKDEEVLANAYNTARQMEIVRESLDNQPVHIDSWIRCLKLNRKLKSKDTSQHIKGEAVDFICPGFGAPIDICRKLIYHNVPFDQLILEHSWVHISFSKKQRRGIILSLLENGEFVTGLTDKQGIRYA